MSGSQVRAVLFAKDCAKVARFYSATLGMKVSSSDDQHSVLQFGVREATTS